MDDIDLQLAANIATIEVLAPLIKAELKQLRLRVTEQQSRINDLQCQLESRTKVLNRIKLEIVRLKAQLELDRSFHCPDRTKHGRVSSGLISANLP